MGAADILKMIETVSPDDTAKLDEIDARVWCFIHKADFKRMLKKARETDVSRFSCYLYNGEIYTPLVCKERKYSRSRDALKAIRPEGYISGIFTCGGKWCDQIRGWCQKPGTKRHEAFETPWDDGDDLSVIATEELAELHAIIQAIEYERTK